MSNIILTETQLHGGNDAGTKARNDVIFILEEMGYRTHVLFERSDGKLRRMLDLQRALRSLDKVLGQGDNVAIQYPYQPSIMRMILKSLKRSRRTKGITITLVVHDVPYLRGESENATELMQQEVDIFNQVDKVIVHNKKMRERLQRDGVKSKLVELEIFDYIYDGAPAIINDEGDTSIVYAGNLKPEKSGFIYDFPGCEGISFNLYGTKPEALKSSMKYVGSFPPDELIESLEGNYGLVWDGPSSKSCEGNFGEYMKLNNPHKLSLYMAAGLPVVVWDQAAVADFVKENQVGVCISSLEELKKLPDRESAEYNRFLENVDKISNRVAVGYYLKKAIKA